LGNPHRGNEHGEFMIVSMIACTPSLRPAPDRRPGVVLGPACLAPGVARLLDPDADGNVGPADPVEELGHYPGLRLGVPQGGHDQLAVQLRRLKKNTQRPRVVDIVADIRVENDRRAISDCGFRIADSEREDSPPASRISTREPVE
jgi:hypothetical protein